MQCKGGLFLFFWKNDLIVLPKSTKKLIGNVYLIEHIEFIVYLLLWNSGNNLKVATEAEHYIQNNFLAVFKLTTGIALVTEN